MIAVSLALGFFAADVPKSLLAATGRLADGGVDAAAEAALALGLSFLEDMLASEAMV